MMNDFRVQRHLIIKAFLYGALSFAALTVLAVLSFYLFAHGTGKSGIWILFIFLRVFVSFPEYLLIGNRTTPPLDNLFVHDVIDVLLNSILGGVIFGIVVALWLLLFKRSKGNGAT
jgi:hypothetical protein